MRWLLASAFVALLAAHSSAQNPPTLYEYYTTGGVFTGLETPPGRFKLNGKNITIYSGSLHYFRVLPEYWRDRLRKMRAAGLNAIETYVPWNLHEPEKGLFDFGDKDLDYSRLLNISQFLRIAQEEDLFVILRPGPYICSEWDFGGLPSWLLRYPGIKVRTSDQIFLGHVQQFFNQLLSQVANLQFTEGGPIIAVQIENEYGSFGADNIETSYLEFIRDNYIQNGIRELLFTCDSAVSSGSNGALPGYLMMANFNNNPAAQFDRLLELQPDKPLMSMEYWAGWFDHWWDKHDTGLSPTQFSTNLEVIFSYNASVNFYMFHGGTTYGFLNGANSLGSSPFYAADTSSYDYDAPLSEAGDYTIKYQLAKDLIAANTDVKTKIPAQPEESAKTAYPTAAVTDFLSYAQFIQQIPSDVVTQIDSVTNMEALNINNGNGQSYGLVVYRKELDLPATAQLQVSGHIRDVAMVVVDGVQKTKRPEDKTDVEGFGYWIAENPTFSIEGSAAGTNTLDVIVDNWARVNFGMPKDFEQKKGLFEGPLLVDGAQLSNITAIPLELKSKWIKSLTGWAPVTGDQLSGPVIVRTKFNIAGTPTDTFLDMTGWSKGSIFVNGFNLGRYFHLGPQVTSYIPAPLLKQGENEIIVFEHYTPGTQLVFTDEPKLEINKNSEPTREL